MPMRYKKWAACGCGKTAKRMYNKNPKLRYQCMKCGKWLTDKQIKEWN